MGHSKALAFLLLGSSAFLTCGRRVDRGAGMDQGAGSVLLFNGTGTSPGDVRALETVLDQSGIAYSTADSAEMNELPQGQLQKYRLLIVPGGNFVDMGNNLSPAATANIRKAIGNGLNYLGICAGAFMGGNSPFNGLNLTAGVRFPF